MLCLLRRSHLFCHPHHHNCHHYHHHNHHHYNHHHFHHHIQEWDHHHHHQSINIFIITASQLNASPFKDPDLTLSSSSIMMLTLHFQEKYPFAQSGIFMAYLPNWQRICPVGINIWPKKGGPSVYFPGGHKCLPRKVAYLPYGHEIKRANQNGTL